MKAMNNEQDKNIKNDTETVVDELLEKFIKLSKAEEED